jgi:hypothetical protein
MKDIVVRNVPLEIWKGVQYAMVDSGKSLKEWVLEAIEEKLKGSARKEESNGSREAERVEPEAEVHGLRGGVREHKRGVGAGEVHGSRHDTQPDGKAVGGGAQQDTSVEEVDEPSGPFCPVDGDSMVWNQKLTRWECECGYRGKAEKR